MTRLTRITTTGCCHSDHRLLCALHCESQFGIQCESQSQCEHNFFVHLIIALCKADICASYCDKTCNSISISWETVPQLWETLSTTALTYSTIPPLCVTFECDWNWCEALPQLKPSLLWFNLFMHHTHCHAMHCNTNQFDEEPRYSSDN